MERLAHESVIFYHSEKKKTTRDNRQEFKRRAGSRKDPTLSSTIQYDELHGKEREQKPRSNFYVHTDWANLRLPWWEGKEMRFSS